MLLGKIYTQLSDKEASVIKIIANRLSVNEYYYLRNFNLESYDFEIFKWDGYYFLTIHLSPERPNRTYKLDSLDDVTDFLANHCAKSKSIRTNSGKSIKDLLKLIFYIMIFCAGIIFLFKHIR